MEPSLEVGVSELHLAAARLQDAGQRLQDGLSNVDLQVQQTLGSGWKGDAASAFGSAWEQWHSGAGQVIRAIQTMSQLLTVAGKEYAKTDEQGAQTIGASMQGGGGMSASASVPSSTGPVGAGGASTAGMSAASGSPSAGGLGSSVAKLAEQMLPSALPAGQPGQLAGQLGQAAQAAAGLAAQLAGASEDGDAASSDDEEHRDATDPEEQAHDTAAGTSDSPAVPLPDTDDPAVSRDAAAGPGSAARPVE